jgi:integrase
MKTTTALAPIKATRKLNLTKERVESFPSPETGYEIYWDAQVQGLGVRVTPHKKTYILQTRLKGKSQSFKRNIGHHPDITPAQARTLANSLKGQIADGNDPRAVAGSKIKNTAKLSISVDKSAKEITLSQLYDKYLKTHTLKAKTQTIYTGALKRCFPTWLDRPIAEITEEMVQVRHREISTETGKRSNQTGAQAQANQAMRVLRTLLNYAGREFKDSKGHSILRENPVKRLSQENAWNKNVRRQSIIHKHQLKPWAEAVMQQWKRLPCGKIDTTARDYLLLCLFTGMRRGEAASLKWVNVEFDAKYLRVESQDTKTNEEHRLPLSDFLFALLSHRFENKAPDDVYVFPGEGKSGHLAECKRVVERVAKQSGVSFMMHDLRRTFITIAESLDIPYYVLKKLVNHKTTSDVTSGYIVTDVDRLREPMQKITDYLIDIAAVIKL